MKRLEVLNSKIGFDHFEAKKRIQAKYFGLSTFDDSIPLFSFVGRITEQKGVILILNTAEMIISKMNQKINILVGGMGSIKDPYVAECVEKIKYLRSKYPNSFWADPNEFFTDGPLINKGSDFGLMPSVFEPGGIVQHEFFIAGTPVLAFKTGGLKDTVVEFDYDKTEIGNGVNFENHTTFDLFYAFERAIRLYNMKDMYAKARENAFRSAIDVIDVARAWDKEFHRLKNKVYYTESSLKESEIKNEALNELLAVIHEFDFERFDFEEETLSKKESFNNKKISTNEEDVSVTFNFPDPQNKFRSVSLCGTFTDWKDKIPLSFNPIFQSWSVVVKLSKGEHQFKYIVDEDKWTINYEEKTSYDDKGNQNNQVIV